LHQMLNYIRGGYGEVTPESEKRLQEHGILNAEDEPNVHELHSSVSTTALLIIGFFTLIVVAMMYLGKGNTLTWIGTIAFLILLWVFTWVSIRAPDPEKTP
jgi:protein-S-isoprenylcysteine O-methyltransferase Ste14